MERISVSNGDCRPEISLAEGREIIKPRDGHGNIPRAKKICSMVNIPRVDVSEFAAKEERSKAERKTVEYTRAGGYR